MNQKQTTNSLTVEVTAYLSINLNGTWELIGFEPNSLDPIEVNGSSPRQTRIDESVREPFNAVKKWQPEEVGAVTKALNRAQENPRHYSNRPSKHNWGDTIRKTQRCTVCGMEGVNKLTCLAHFNGGDRVHRKATGVF